jgi:integrase
LQPLVDALRKYVLGSGKLHGDDVPVPVLEPGNGKTKTGRLWTYVRDDRPSGSEEPAAVWFAYSPDRKGEHPARHLEKYAGVLQALEMKQTPSCVSKLPYIPMVHVDNARGGFLEYSDHHTVVAELPRSLKALFVIAFHSGCRLGEILNMRWSDVDWKNRNIRLPKTKNGTKRNLPFWGGIESHLKAQKEFRDAHHQDAEKIFFWCAEDCGLSHGGVRLAPGSPIQDFKASWSAAVKRAHTANANINGDLLFHDLRRSAVRCMIQDAGIPESQAMLISGHKTRTMLERYNIVSLKNVQDAGTKLDAWSRALATPAATSNPQANC